MHRRQCCQPPRRVDVYLRGVGPSGRVQNLRAFGVPVGQLGREVRVSSLGDLLGRRLVPREEFFAERAGGGGIVPIERAVDAIASQTPAGAVSLGGS
jgi:hypothetical protein